jgi:menaquinone-dependent protoporphyrinogen IX oxidase
MKGLYGWLTVWLAACAAHAAAGEPAILIASDGSAFKQAVVAKIVDWARETKHPTEVVDLKGLKAEKAAEYRAVVILDRVWAWRLSGSTRKFLKALSEEQKGRVIVVSTANDTDWRLKEKGLHAITSASKTDKVNSVAAFVTGRLQEILKGEAPPAAAPSAP